MLYLTSLFVVKSVRWVISYLFEQSKLSILRSYWAVNILQLINVCRWFEFFL